MKLTPYVSKFILLSEKTLTVYLNCFCFYLHCKWAYFYKLSSSDFQLNHLTRKERRERTTTATLLKSLNWVIYLFPFRKCNEPYFPHWEKNESVFLNRFIPPTPPVANFTNVLCQAFTLVDPETVKNTVKSSVSFYAFGICVCKSCTLNVDEIEPRLT